MSGFDVLPDLLKFLLSFSKCPLAGLPALQGRLLTRISARLFTGKDALARSMPGSLSLWLCIGSCGLAAFGSCGCGPFGLRTAGLGLK